MDVVRQAVAGSWEKHSALQFVGWGQCAKLNEGIRITVLDEGPRTRGLGCQLQLNDVRKGFGYAPAGMILNFKFENWGAARCLNNKDSCIRAIAVHEFGHAIGLAHEQNRPDTPGECAKKRDASPVGDLHLTPYDPQSRMNYCFDIYAEGNAPLSELDIDAVKKLYRE